MIEIVFSDSACGGLKMAQRCGGRNDIGGCTSMYVSKQDGSEPTPDELKEAQKTAEEHNCPEWEKAAPMGGNPQDVFGFNLVLSIGDISKDDFANRRQQSINELWSIYPSDPSTGTFDVTSKLLTTLDDIRERAVHGENIRIWYSSQPDELCGLYWFMAELLPFEEQLGTVFTVKLPENEYYGNNRVVNLVSWGDIFPEEWHRYTTLAETTTSAFHRHCAAQWRDLQTENAHLRATLNGKLVSVPENIYDDFILREIAVECDEFLEAKLIGRVLGKYRLGIGDAWIAHRIEKMIDDGKLAIAGNPPPDRPGYHRKLKKIHIL